MLIEFRVKNFRSIKDEQVLSMVASSDKDLESNCFNIGKMKLLKSAAIYGANASGKSNIIKAMDSMRNIIERSASLAPNSPIPVNPFKLDSICSKKPSSFDVSIIIEGIRYQYGFTADSTRIHNEWLYAYPKGLPQRWFERSFNNETLKHSWKFGSFLKGEKERLTEKTRESSLFLSVATQWNHEQLSVIFNWFHVYLRTFPANILWSQDTASLIYSIKHPDHFNTDFYKIIIGLVKNADLGIRDIVVEKQLVEEVMDRLDAFKGLPNDVKESLIDKFKSDTVLNVAFLHDSDNVDLPVSFQFEDESDGTIKFFHLIGPWIEAILKGYTIFIDELDTSLHPLLIRTLIELMHEPHLNKNGAQLVFTAHDTTLLDPELLRRDQLYLTEKGKNGATQLYSIADYKARKGEAIQKRYLSGRYGGIPILKAFGIDEK